MLERLQQIRDCLFKPDTPQPHPLDPLSELEIEYAVSIVSETHGPKLRYNTVCLSEPKKAEMLAWLEAPEVAPRPLREAEVVVVGHGYLCDGIVDLTNGVIKTWEKLTGVQPMVSDTLYLK